MKKVAMVLIAIIMSACSSAPTNPYTDCPYELDGIQGNVGESYAIVYDLNGDTNNNSNYSSFECASPETGTWAADVWSYVEGSHDGHDLSEFFLYKNGKEMELSRILEISGEQVMFDTGGNPYTAALCGELWNPTDTKIVRWGRTAWQFSCYGKGLQ